MLYPEFLRKGDTIAIVSPCKHVSEAELAPNLEQLRNWGYEVVLGKNVYAKNGFFAGTDKERAEDLQWAIEHPYAKAILMTRGGYGLIRIIDQIDFSAFAEKAKWLIGYSDATVIHNHLFQKNIASMHAPMLMGLTTIAEPARGHWQDLIKGNAQSIAFVAGTESNVKDTRIEGRMIGGNLSLLYALQGSHSFPYLKDCILFIEEIDEYRYHVDRILMSLSRSGALNGLKALVVGYLTDVKESTTPYGMSSEAMILERFEALNIPVIFGYPAGHEADHRGFVQGAMTKIEMKDHKVLVSQDWA
jgi:muramoyltetrapeptide carboxypeptidase